MTKSHIMNESLHLVEMSLVQRSFGAESQGGQG